MQGPEVLISVSRADVSCKGVTEPRCRAFSFPKTTRSPALHYPSPIEAYRHGRHSQRNHSDRR